MYSLLFPIVALTLRLSGVCPAAIAKQPPNPPRTRALAAPVHPSPPHVTLGPTHATMQNAHLMLRLSTAPGLSLVGLRNKPAAVDCLAPRRYSALFAVLAGTKLVSSEQCKVTRTRRALRNGTAVVSLELAVADPPLDGLLTVRMDDSRETTWSLRLTNRSRRRQQLRVFFPLFQHLQIGDNLAGNYYFYPFKGGWTGNEPYHLGHGYGTPSGSLQLMSVFAPETGAGVYSWVKDKSGAMKSLWLRKVEADGVAPPVYESLRPQMRADKLPFDLHPGISLAVSPFVLDLAPGQALALPEAVLGVHVGDWRQPLASYVRWVRTWWRPPSPPTPDWFRRCFNVPSVHDHDSIAHHRYRLPDALLPRHHLLQWAFYWKHSHTDRLGKNPKPDRWYRNTHGDYDYEDRWGGLPALRQEIVRAHNRGVAVQLYVQSYLVWKHSRLGKEHGADWVARSQEGRPRTDWTSPDTNMDVWDFCVGAPAYQRYLAQTCTRLLTDTGADSIYLDSAADAYPCYDARHGHGREWARFSLDMLRTVRQAIKATHPNAPLQIEDVCSEHHLQYVDGAWLKEFEAYPPMSNYTPHFQAYPLYFLRFYFPEVWFADWGSGDDPVGWRRCFFNGIGLSRWPGDYCARTGRVMRENAAAFASLRPIPLIPTLRPGVFANEFPTDQKVIYTIYNRTPAAASGPLLSVPTRPGVHYVELLSGNEVQTESQGQQTRLSLTIPSGEVVAVAQLPRLLSVTGAGARRRVIVDRPVPHARLRALVSNDPDDPGIPLPLQSLSAPLDPSRLSAASGRVVLKLFTGDELADAVRVK